MLVVTLADCCQRLAAVVVTPQVPLLYAIISSLLLLPEATVKFEAAALVRLLVGVTVLSLNFSSPLNEGSSRLKETFMYSPLVSSAVSVNGTNSFR